MNKVYQVAMSLMLVAAVANAKTEHKTHHGPDVDDQVIAKQRAELAKNTKDKGFGPQSPRNIDKKVGTNERVFGLSPDSKDMNLCNIHFHKNAEHAGGEFSKYAGNGDGHGYKSGYIYTGKLTKAERAATKSKICDSKHGDLKPGNTIESHYVYSTADVKPGPTLGSCLSESIKNPQLRVETQVFVLVNDPKALDFNTINKVVQKNGRYQANAVPQNSGKPVVYTGSTTGPDYNEKGSPFQVTWSVRPKVQKLNIESVGKWCEGNEFKEDHAHGVRNLVVNPALLSPIK